MQTVRYFTDVVPYAQHLAGGRDHLSGSVELMCHPGAVRNEMDDSGSTETDFLVGDGFAACLRSARLISYAELDLSLSKHGGV